MWRQKENRPLREADNRLLNVRLSQLGLQGIDKVTVVETGDCGNCSSSGKYRASLMATAPEMLKSVSGLDLDKVVKGLVDKNKNNNFIEIDEPK